MGEGELKCITLLEMSMPLPLSKIANVSQYPLPAAAHVGIYGVVTDLGKMVYYHLHSLPI